MRRVQEENLTVLDGIVFHRHGEIYGICVYVIMGENGKRETKF
jgi:hypothetical protein